MGEITLDEIWAVMKWLIGFAGSCVAIVAAVRKAIKEGFKPIEKQIEKVDKNATMNYIVARLDEIDKGNKLDGVSKKRFYEEYEHYVKDLNGNTYIHDEFERLKKEGKL